MKRRTMSLRTRGKAREIRNSEVSHWGSVQGDLALRAAASGQAQDRDAPRHKTQGQLTRASVDGEGVGGKLGAYICESVMRFRR